MKYNKRKVVIEDVDIVKRWNAYIQESCDGENTELFEVTNLECKHILKEETTVAIKYKLKNLLKIRFLIKMDTINNALV